jgi:hypothetical protein
VAFVHDHGEVLSTDYDERGTTLEAMLDEKTHGELEAFLVQA